MDLDAYAAALARADWFYQKSDDPTAYAAGCWEIAALRALWGASELHGVLFDTTQDWASERMRRNA
jgi:hypothetical protein